MKKLITLLTLTTIFDGAAMLEKVPKQLYKIVSLENWEKSKNEKNLVLSDVDTEFIHFSCNKDQLDYVINKFWKNTSYVLVVINTQKTPGTYKLEYNRSKTDQFWHLYNGAIPLSAIEK